MILVGKENGDLAFNKGLTVIEENNNFTYTKVNGAWKLTKLSFGSPHSASNYDPQILEDNNKPKKTITTTNFPASVKYNGAYVDGIKWNDKNGINYLVISQIKAGDYGKSGYKIYCLPVVLLIMGMRLEDYGKFKMPPKTCLLKWII